jgi:o-succinylbenzoate synthase
MLECHVPSIVTERGLHFRAYAPVRLSACHAPILLMHGWLGSCLDMHALALALCDAGHVVLTPDMPLHALSCCVAPQSPRDAALVIATAAQTIVSDLQPGAPPTVVVGYSLGGRIALEMVCDRQSREALDVGALVMISAAPPAEDAPESTACAQNSRHDNFAARIRSFAGDRDACRDWLVNTWYRAPMWGELKSSVGFDDLIASRLDALYPTDEDDRLHSVAEAATVLAPCNMTVPFDASMLSDVDVLYVFGAGDAKYASLAADFKKRCARDGVTVDCVCVLDAAHNVLAENPYHVQRVLRRFISPIARRTSKPFRLDGYRLKQYDIPLKATMTVSGQSISTRSGALVSLSCKLASDYCKFLGVGDIAPLPGLHAETVEDCVGQLERWAEQFVAHQPHGLQAHQVRDLADALCSFPLHPSLQSALVSAIMQCIADINGMDLVGAMRTLFGRWDDFSDSIYVNGVAPRPTVSTSAASCDVAGNVADLMRVHNVARVLKLKVGASSVATDVKVVNMLAAEMRTTRRSLRLDANCSWTADQYALFCEQTRPSHDIIEYVEEPWAWNLQRSGCRVLQSFCGSQVCESAGDPHSPFIGLDESLVPFSIVDTIAVMASPIVSAIILKPSVQGSLYRIVALANAAQSCGAKVVLSSVFESGVGLAWTSVLASSLGDPSSVEHGIGTYTSLATDCAAPSFEASCVISPAHDRSSSSSTFIPIRVSAAAAASLLARTNSVAFT